MTAAALFVEGLCKQYNGTDVLKSVDLSVPAGGTLALLGRSGSGKSTVLRCLNLLELPEKGKLILNGQTYFSNGELLFEPWEIRSNISLVMQDYSLFPNMTVAENLSFGLRRGFLVAASEAYRQVRDLARSLGLENLLDRYPASLSGGQTQRCALARALILRPQVLLLDEITSALDPESIRSVVGAISQIREIPGAQKMTIILVTHLVRFAEQFADEIAFLSDGRIVERLPSETFIEGVSHTEARRFVEAQLIEPV